jgi:hypothetical protein
MPTLIFNPLYLHPLSRHHFLSFFERVDRALRRSLGVSETAKTETEVKPAPPQASSALPDIVEPEVDPNDFIEMKDFKESLNPELQKTFGSPRLKDRPMAFDAVKERTRLLKEAEEMAAKADTQEEGEEGTDAEHKYDSGSTNEAAEKGKEEVKEESKHDEL